MAVQPGTDGAVSGACVVVVAECVAVLVGVGAVVVVAVVVGAALVGGATVDVCTGSAESEPPPQAAASTTMHRSTPCLIE